MLIQLTKNKETIVDEKYYNILIKYRWQADIRDNNIYAVRKYRGNSIKMHRVIIELAGFNIGVLIK